MATINEREIRDILSSRGASPAVIEQVVIRYRASQRTGNMGAWSDDLLYEWIDTQLRSIGGGGRYATQGADARPGERDFSGVSQQAAAMVEAQQATDRDYEAVAEMARQAASERQQQVQDRVFGQARIDYGATWDPAVIAQSLGAGVWMDPAGNYIDANGDTTDVPTPVDHNVIWQAIKGQTFNMGSLSMGIEGSGLPPGWGGVGGPNRKNLGSGAPASIYNDTSPSSYGPDRTGQAHRKKRYVTPSMALALLDNMDEAYLVQLQQQMFQAGLYGEDARPDWGEADIATREAFRGLFIEASLNPRLPINEVLRDLIDRRLDAQEMTPGSPGAGGTGQILELPTLELPDFQPTVMSDASATEALGDLAQDLLGEYLSPEQMNDIKATLREREISIQRQQYDSDVTRIRDAYNLQVQNLREGAAAQQSFGGGGQGGGGSSQRDVDAFLAAISGQESNNNYDAHNQDSGAHGKYQFMPDTWRSYARRAGLGANAPMTPENQEIVARQMAMDLFAQFGNWRDVAIGWYAGPGAVGANYLDASQGDYPTINQYADQIMQRMRGGQQQGIGPTGLIEVGGGQTGGNTLAPIEQFDPAAEMAALVKAADPVGYQTNEWGDRANMFFSALSGVIGAGN